MAESIYGEKGFDDLMDLTLRATNLARLLHHFSTELDLKSDRATCRAAWIDLIEMTEFCAFDLEECAREAVATLTEWGNFERGAQGQGKPDPYRERFDQRQKSNGKHVG
jgi:hypothetical protein